MAQEGILWKGIGIKYVHIAVNYQALVNKAIDVSFQTANLI
jgi:hypothetical protein